MQGLNAKAIHKKSKYVYFSLIYEFSILNNKFLFELH